jgi:hypothetical protein
MGKPPGNGGSVCGVAGWLALRLDGEGVLEALHALFQVLDLALLLGQEEVFDPVQPDLDSGDVLFAARAYVFKHNRTVKGVNGGVEKKKAMRGSTAVNKG